MKSWTPVNISKNEDSHKRTCSIFTKCLLIKVLFKIFTMEMIIFRSVFKLFPGSHWSVTYYSDWPASIWRLLSVFWWLHFIITRPILIWNFSAQSMRVERWVIQTVEIKSKWFSNKIYYWTLYQCYLQFTFSVSPEVLSDEPEVTLDNDVTREYLRCSIVLLQSVWYGTSWLILIGWIVWWVIRCFVRYFCGIDGLWSKHR